jgi:DinB superfamily
MTIRTEALAKRITQGAESLAAFAEKLSDEEWSSIVPPDGRRVGVIIHHVASVYPIEIQLAQQIASGNAIIGVTRDAIDEMNAKHAHDYAAVGKHETLELLRRNSRAAAEQVRALTDEQLDCAVPVSLNADAPLTAQFLIEDHALRHSWHHLAKIKSALQAKVNPAKLPA